MWGKQKQGTADYVDATVLLSLPADRMSEGRHDESLESVSFLHVVTFYNFSFFMYQPSYEAEYPNFF